MPSLVYPVSINIQKNVMNSLIFPRKYLNFMQRIYIPAAFLPFCTDFVGKTSETTSFKARLEHKQTFSNRFSPFESHFKAFLLF